MPAPEETSREELIALLAQRDARIAAQDTQISALSTQVADLVEANERLMAQLARLEHLLSSNSANSSMPPSKDDDPGKTPPPAKPKRDAGSKRKRGKQPGAPGANLAWTDNPNRQLDRFPQGRCECGHDLADAADLGIVDRHQQHEISQISVSITQYDQHQVRCGCGHVYAADRPEGARAGVVGYGPKSASLRRLPHGGALHSRAAVRRAAGIADRRRTQRRVCAWHAHPRVRAAGRGRQADPRPDHPGLRRLRWRDPAAGRPEKAETGPEEGREVPAGRCTELYTHYLLGDRDLATFTAFVLKDLTDSVIVHDRYHLYDNAEIGKLTHQLCCQHLLRDLNGAAEVYPEARWPTQIADALRGLIHEANLARETGRDAIEQTIKDELIKRFRRRCGSGCPNQPRGVCLFRSADPTDRSSWRAWNGNTTAPAFDQQMLNPYMSTHAPCAVLNPDTFSSSVWSVQWHKPSRHYIAIFRDSGGVRYATSPDLMTWKPAKTLLVSTSAAANYRSSTSTAVTGATTTSTASTATARPTSSTASPSSTGTRGSRDERSKCRTIQRTRRVPRIRTDPSPNDGSAFAAVIRSLREV